METYKSPSKEKIIGLAIFGSAGYLAAQLKIGLICQIILAGALGILVDFLRKRVSRYISATISKNRETRGRSGR